MIEVLNSVIGRNYTVLTDTSGNPIYAVSGLDIEWIASAIFICITTYIMLKMFVRIFIK